MNSIAIYPIRFLILHSDQIYYDDLYGITMNMCFDPLDLQRYHNVLKHALLSIYGRHTNYYIE
jgi:hypothetical protein